MNFKNKSNNTLSLVGISYNNGLLTNDAQEAIKNSEVIIGHKNFIDQVKKYISPNTHSFDILELVKEHMDFREFRVQHAIKHVLEGKNVVLLSSGDPGIWGMAAYVFPEIQNQGLTNKDIKIKIIPGITAGQYAASKLGAPLMNGFAFVSLCDDLTPKEVIKKRIKACADGDFVLVVYKLRYNAEYAPELYPINEYPEFHPPIKRAKEEFDNMIETLVKTRSPKTPVAICKNLGALEEEINVVELGELSNYFNDTNLTSILIIGNTESKFEGEWLVSNR